MKENRNTRRTSMSRAVINKQATSFRSNVKLARSLWGALSIASRKRLKELIGQYGFSVAAGDLQLLDGHWYVTHAGLLRVAFRRRCYGIEAVLVDRPCDTTANRW